MRTARKREITRIIGLMSGTSHDGVDAALVEIRPGAPLMGGGTKGHQNIGSWVKGHGSRVMPTPLAPCALPHDPLEEGFSDEIDLRLIKHLHIPYRKPLRDTIRKAFNGDTELICNLNFRLGEVFAGAVLSLLKTTGVRPEDISAVASHGQTICHSPPSSRRPGSTLQIGEASVIAEKTGILTIADFRTADMAAGGQGAPLVPLADYLLFRRAGEVRAIVNIGGIANVTIVREKIDDTTAFDTGPGNSLIDEAMLLCSGGKRSFDRDGSFARSGRPVKRLSDELLSHPYFRKRPPKSTGRETFGTTMVEDIFRRYGDLIPRDILATLTYLTAIAIYDALIKFRPNEVILTGGGVKNRFLSSLIQNMFRDRGVAVNDISVYGIPPQAKEAVSFAILGYQTLNYRAGNLPSATGARHGVILGKITPPSHNQSVLPPKR